MDFSFITDMIAGTTPGQTSKIASRIPQTQQDIHNVAQQFPVFHQQLTEAQDSAENFAYAQLVLQALTVAATVGMFIYTVSKEK